jgi:hypothetical protein
MLAENRTRPQYDVPTAVTFLLGGVALGAILTLLFSPLRLDVAAGLSSKPREEDMPVPAGRVP